MTSDIAISVENLSKKFRIGTGNSPGYHRASEFISGLPRFAWNSLRRSISQRRAFPEPTALAAGCSAHCEPTALAAGLPPANEFWALKDVSFEVKQGEVVGIIGRNGAGKSTLLKILSRITEPTSGRFGIRGRVASLLEVGTGFHPELTGRENIFVSGITLGMTRAEIKKRFDEIVDFSGVEKFLDTPVKHYSSGMQVRLGFAVAAHLESEILIVDEVLAVGDAEFQKKCLGKMERSAVSGQSILLVSHQLPTVRNLCSRSILLESGSITLDSRSDAVVDKYCRANEQLVAKCLRERNDREGNGLIRFARIALNESEACTVKSGSKLRVTIDLDVDQSAVVGAPHIALTIEANSDCVLTCFATSFAGASLTLKSPTTRVYCDINEFNISPGNYTINAWVATKDGVEDSVSNACTFEVTYGDLFQSGSAVDSRKHGHLLLRHYFSVG